MDTQKTYTKVSELLHAEGASPEFISKYRARATEVQLLEHLILLRHKRGKTQGEISQVLKCTQSRVSKIESAGDDELTIGYLKKYVEALDFNLVLTFVPKESPAVDQVKYHVAQIERNLAHLVTLAKGDDAAIRGGIGNFFGEALFNLVNMVTRQASKLPNQPFRIEVIEGPQELLTPPEGKKQLDAGAPDLTACR